MPIKKAAQKAERQSLKRRIKNQKIKVELKKARKIAVAGMKSKEGPEKVKAAIILIDKAVREKIIHKNKAARLKSKLMKKMAELKLEMPKKVKKAASRKPVKKVTKKTKKFAKKSAKKSTKSKK